MVERRATYIAPRSYNKATSTGDVSPPPGEKPKAEGAALADDKLCRTIGLRLRT